MTRLRSLMAQATNYTYTENGAVAHRTTGNPLLDFFALSGGLRGRAMEEVLPLFEAAFAHDPLRALKALFYLRDCRGGQGERDIPRAIFCYLAHTRPQLVVKNMALIPEYGRWDDLFVFFDTPVERQMLTLIRETMLRELGPGAKPSLIWKWLPSINTSSAESRGQARKIARFLHWSDKRYRRTLAMMRQRLDVVEVKMTDRQWSDIAYPHVPAYAMKLYRNAFHRHDTVRFQEYLNALAEGKEKVNAKVLFPYDIIRMVHQNGNNYDLLKLYEAQWDTLKHGFENDDNAIAVVDVSGSMRAHLNALPLYSALALGLLLAETNRGPWRNAFITFSARPQLLQIEGQSLYAKVQSMFRDGGLNTDIEAVFDLLLETARQHNLTQDEMPRKVVIISDMEFDASRYEQVTGHKFSNDLGLGYAYAFANTSPALFQQIRQRWEDAGYELPLLIFWNVAARNTHVPATKDDRGVVFVSGHSPSIFQRILNPDALDAERLMLEVLDSERYAPVTL